MKNVLEKLWFQPTTLVLVPLLIILVIAKFVYPVVQKAIQAQKVDVPLPQAPTSPTPSLISDKRLLLETIGKLIVLPTDEDPQIIPITQIEQFRDQPFFRNAKNGDVLLLYNQNKKAILYDVEGNKILDTAPLAATPTPQNPQNDLFGPANSGSVGSLATQSATPIQPSPTPSPSPFPTPSEI